MSNHLINPAPLQNMTPQEARDELRAAHDYLVDCYLLSVNVAPKADLKWAIAMKRQNVDLSASSKPVPRCVREKSTLKSTKKTERLAEVVNILATVERLIDALDWFANEENGFNHLKIKVCNPSTSSVKKEESIDNDLILWDNEKQERVLCEVCDVVSCKSDSNGKEAKELESLGHKSGELLCGDKRRFIVTSPEFGKYIYDKNNRRKLKQYDYKPIVFCQNGAVMLELINV